MKTCLALALVLVSVTAAAPSAAPGAKPLSVRGGFGHLIAPGEHVFIGYTVYVAGGGAGRPAPPTPAPLLRITRPLPGRYGKLASL